MCKWISFVLISWRLTVAHQVCISGKGPTSENLKFKIDSKSHHVLGLFTTYLFCRHQNVWLTGYKVIAFTDTSTLIRRYCNGDRVDDIVSADRYMYLQFETDFFLNSNGFEIYYSATSSLQRKYSISYLAYNMSAHSTQVSSFHIHCQIDYFPE